MWPLATPDFYIAVCVRRGNGGAGQPLDPTREMVRARLREHLDALKVRFADALASRRGRG